MLFQNQKCKCCESLRDEIVYLRELVNRLMILAAPPVLKNESEPVIEKTDQNKETINYGDV